VPFFSLSRKKDFPLFNECPSKGGGAVKTNYSRKSRGRGAGGGKVIFLSKNAKMENFAKSGKKEKALEKRRIGQLTKKWKGLAGEGCQDLKKKIHHRVGTRGAGNRFGLFQAGRRPRSTGERGSGAERVAESPLIQRKAKTPRSVQRRVRRGDKNRGEEGNHFGGKNQTRVAD